MNEMRCPYCNSVITSKIYDEVLGKMRKEVEEISKKERLKLETELKSHYEKHFAEQRKKLEDEKTLLNDTKRGLAEEKRDLTKKGKEMKKLAESEAKLKFERRLQEQKNLVKKKLDELTESRKQFDVDRKAVLQREKETKIILEKQIKSKYGQQYEFDKELLRKKMEDLDEHERKLKQELELKHETQLQKDRDRLDKVRRELEEKEFRFKKEKADLVDLHNSRERALERSVEDLKQQLERRTLQEIGDIPEERLKDTLHKEFPEDIFERFGKGRAGGDVIQTIMLNGSPIGKILYENKNDRNWLNRWIDKIKQDRTEVGTTYAILVSKAFPRNEKHFGIIKGIPVVSPRLLPHIARIIRTSIIAVERQKLSAFEKEEKVSALYTYLNSAEFKSSATTVGDSVEKLNKMRQDERTQHIKHWEEETTEVNKISDHFTKIVSKVDTIIESEDKPLPVKNKKKIMTN